MTLQMRPLGQTGLQVSVLGFGALEIGRDWALDVEPSPQHLTLSAAGNLLNSVLDRGINFIDTAPAYWHSEDYIGRSLGNRRDNFILATKVGEHCDPDSSYYDYSAAATREFVDKSLRRLCTDDIDLIQIHSASIEVLEQGETWSALDQARSEGKVRFIGMTGSVEAATRAVTLGGYDTVQVPYNLMALEAAQELFPICRQNQVGVIIMRSLSGGKLTKKFRNLQDVVLRAKLAKAEEQASQLYPECDDPLAYAAMRFVSAENAVSTIIVGTRRIETVDQNLKSLVAEVSAKELEELKKIASVFFDGN